jgi:hypothetical protein
MPTRKLAASAETRANAVIEIAVNTVAARLIWDSPGFAVERQNKHARRYL